MIFRILLIAILLPSCAYHRANKDRECNHSHICCDMGCACCGRKVGLLNAEPLDIRRTTIIYTDSLGNSLKASETEILHFNFEGSEPYWSLEMNDHRLEMLVENEKYEGVIQVSNKSENGETYGFQNDVIYGVVNRTWEKSCWHAVTEEDSLAYEIYFVYKDKTYKGCGTKLE